MTESSDPLQREASSRFIIDSESRGMIAASMVNNFRQLCSMPPPIAIDTFLTAVPNYIEMPSLHRRGRDAEHALANTIAPSFGAMHRAFGIAANHPLMIKVSAEHFSRIIREYEERVSRRKSDIAQKSDDGNIPGQGTKPREEDKQSDLTTLRLAIDERVRDYSTKKGLGKYDEYLDIIRFYLYETQSSNTKIRDTLIYFITRRNLTKAFEHIAKVRRERAGRAALVAEQQS